MCVNLSPKIPAGYSSVAIVNSSKIFQAPYQQHLVAELSTGQELHHHDKVVRDSVPTRIDRICGYVDTISVQKFLASFTIMHKQLQPL